MAILDYLLGQPLSSRDERHEKVDAVAGVPIFGLDALSSAVLTLLIPLAAAGWLRFSP